MPKNNNNNDNTNDYVAVKRTNLSEYHMTEDRTTAQLLFLFLSDSGRVAGILICHGMANGLWLCMPFTCSSYLNTEWVEWALALLCGRVMNTTPRQRWQPRWRQRRYKQQWNGSFCLMVCHLQDIETELWNFVSFHAVMKIDLDRHTHRLPFSITKFYIFAAHIGNMMPDLSLFNSLTPMYVDVVLQHSSFSHCFSPSTSIRCRKLFRFFARKRRLHACVNIDSVLCACVFHFTWDILN